MNGQIEAGAASFSAHMGDICGKFKHPHRIYCIVVTKSHPT